MIDWDKSSSPEHHVAMTVHALNSALAELQALARKPDTAALVADEKLDLYAALQSLLTLVMEMSQERMHALQRLKKAGIE